MIIVCLATMFAISWQLTLFVLILLPTAGYFMGQVGKKLKRRSLEGQNQWGLLMSIIEETWDFGRLRIVKGLHAEDKMIKWFHDDNNRFYSNIQSNQPPAVVGASMSEFLARVPFVSSFGMAVRSSCRERAVSMPLRSFTIWLFFTALSIGERFVQSRLLIQKGLASMVRVDLILSR